MKSNRMTSTLADEGVGMESEINSRRFPPKKSGVSDSDDQESAELYAAAVSAMNESGKVSSAILGVSESHLSEMKNATRAVTLSRLIGQIRRNRTFAIALIRGLAKVAGNLEVRERGRVDKNELRKQVEMTYKRNPVVLRAVLADAAQALGIDEEEAHEVWGEPTQEIEIA